MSQARALLEDAHARGIEPTIVQSSGAIIIVLATAGPNVDGLLSLDEARVLAKLKTTRPILDAVRAGELKAFGKQRSRTVRRSDLLAWVESRSVKPIAGLDDLDIQRRIKRLEHERAGAERGAKP